MGDGGVGLPRELGEQSVEPGTQALIAELGVSALVRDPVWDRERDGSWFGMGDRLSHSRTTSGAREATVDGTRMISHPHLLSELTINRNQKVKLFS